MTTRRPPSPHLADELARSEAPDDAPPLSVDELPDRHGRVVPASESWRQHLVQKEIKHRVVTSATSPNVATYLRYHPQWRGVVVYDEFRETAVTTRVPSWSQEDAHEQLAPGPWTDLDTARLVAWFARNDGIEMPVGEIERGLATAADTCRIHPVRDYLRGLEWDGVPRIGTWLRDLLGAADGPYERGVGPRWLISAVARVMRPGAQVDCVLILEGKTGGGKTSIFRELVPVREWYADTALDLSNKDSLDALRSVWIYGLDELDSIRKGDVTRIKNFLTQTRDRYRPPYGHRPKDFLRQNVFCGTTNEDEYLIDRTGNRRFWPVRVADTIDWQAIAGVRDQLWAETFARYQAGDPWHVNTVALRELCDEQQRARVVAHPWVELVGRWLATPTQLELEDGRSYRSPFDLSRGVTTTDVLVHCIGVPRKDCDTRNAMASAAALRDNGWIKARGRVDGDRTPRFHPPPRGEPAAEPEPDDIDRE